MKLIILQSVFILLMLIKNIILKTSIVSTEDFIVNFKDNFKSQFESEEKLQNFKKHLIKKMKYRIKERFLRNSMLMNLLQVKDRVKLTKSFKSKKEKIKKLNNLKKNNKRLISSIHIKTNTDNEAIVNNNRSSHNSHSPLAKNRNFTSEAILPQIKIDDFSFISLKNETHTAMKDYMKLKPEEEKQRVKSSFALIIDFKIQNSSLLLVQQKKKKKLIDDIKDNFNISSHNNSSIIHNEKSLIIFKGETSEKLESNSNAEMEKNSNNQKKINNSQVTISTKKNSTTKAASAAAKITSIVANQPPQSVEKHHIANQPSWQITKEDFITHKSLKSDFLPKGTTHLLLSSSSSKSDEATTNEIELNSNSTLSEASNSLNLTNSSSSKKTSAKRRSKANTNLDIFDWSFGDINSYKRVTKFYINLESKCNIFINDTIYYDKDDYTSNFIDHLILHNNFDSIEPRSIYSTDVLINYFIFNKKLNMFTVNFENEKHRNYSIVYEYFANNLIKLQQNKKDFYSNNNNEKNVNEFLWKFYNENTNSKNLSLEVEFYFTIDKYFMHENVEFNNKMFMYKTRIENKDTLVFKWSGTLMPYEVKVFESVFPMLFENCQMMTVNFTMILIGAFFVIFIVLILYLLFSSIAKDLN